MRKRKQRHAIDRDLLCVCIDFCLLLLSVNSRDAFSKLCDTMCVRTFMTRCYAFHFKISFTLQKRHTIIRSIRVAKPKFCGSLLMLYFQFKWSGFEREKKIAEIYFVNEYFMKRILLQFRVLFLIHSVRNLHFDERI